MRESRNVDHGFIRVARASEVPPGAVRWVWVGSLSVALCNVNGEFFAIENVCTHDGGLLGAGELNGYQLECPRHGARFDVRSGQARSLPAVAPVATFAVRVRDDDIEVTTSGAGRQEGKEQRRC